MLDIKFIRENPDAVKENIKKKFQEQKLPLVDQVLELDAENRRTIQEAQELRTARNAKSKQVGVLMGQSKKDPSKLAEAEALKAEVKADADRPSWRAGSPSWPRRSAASCSRSPTSSIPPCPSAPTTPATWRCNASARQHPPPLKSPTTPKSWSPSTASTWTPPAGYPARASTT